MLDKDAATAIIRIDPHDDKKLMAMAEEAIRVRDDALAIKVEDDIGMTIASDGLAVIAKLKKALEAERKSYTEPLDAYKKSIMETFRIITDPIKEADQVVRDKVLAYQEAVAKKKADIEKINAEKVRLAQEEMRVNGEMSQPLDLIPVMDAAPDRVNSEVGGLSSRTNWKWRLVDIALVPKEYLQVNDVLVTTLVRKGGMREIAGIEIYPEKSLKVTAHKEFEPKLTQAGKEKIAELGACEEGIKREPLPDFGSPLYRPKSDQELPAF